MKRTVQVVIVVVAIQAVLIGSYWLLERQRRAEGDAQVALGTEPPQRVDLALPPLTLQARDGQRVDLQGVDTPTLLHFWATWCPPCRHELPGLLALSERQEIQVRAVALDDSWEAVEAFDEDLSSQQVLLGQAREAEKRLDVRKLPVTFLVQSGGRIVLRFDGARDWADPVFQSAWIAGPAGSP